MASLSTALAAATSAELAATAALAAPSAPPAAPGVGGQGCVHLDGGALDARNLEGPIAIARLTGHRHLAVQSGETEHLDVDIPNAGGEFEGIAAVLAGIGNDFGAALPCGNSGAGNELVGGPDGAAVLRGG